MTSLLGYVGMVASHEMTAKLDMQVAGENGLATGALQTLVRERISDCPNDLALLLAEVEAK